MYTSMNNGKIKFKLAEILEKKKIAKYKLSTISGVRFDTIQRMCQGNLSRIDLEIICRLCNALDCTIDDLIEYKK